MGDIMTRKKPRCFSCKHYEAIENLYLDEGVVSTCRAFPKGIPEDILWGEDLHNEVREDQEGEFVFLEVGAPDE